MSKSVALIGDLIIDKFKNYSSLKLSPEGPAPVVKKIGFYATPGGAANVALSLLNLGLNFSFYHPYSKKIDKNIDNDMKNILKDLDKHSRKIFTNIENINPIKTRYYVDNRQYMREDKEANNLSELSIVNKSLIKDIVDNYDFLIVSDYQKGCLNSNSLKFLIETCNVLRKPLFIDTKIKDAKVIKNSFCLKINKAEFNLLFPNYELYDNSSIEDIKDKVKKAKNIYQIKNLVVTLGSQGCLAITESNTIYCEAFKVDVIDITGAGDAFLSALFYSFLNKKTKNNMDYFNNSLDIEDLTFANYAASIVVSKEGTVAIDSNYNLIYNAKFNKNKIIGFTNGCFDLLHMGHIHILEQARKYCDFLIVGLNSDKSIKRIKGNQRPINNQDFRKKLLKTLKTVDKVIIFEEDTPENLIKTIKPDVLIKGGDYKEEEIIGSNYVKKYGGKVIIVEFVHDTSSTKIIDKIKSL